MKKIISLLVSGLVLAGAAFAQVPALQDSSAYLIDTTKLAGTMKDKVVVTNVSSSAANFEVTISCYDEDAKAWTVFGKGKLKGLSDQIEIKSMNKKLVKLETFKYVSIRPSADNPFKYTAVKNDDNLNIWIFDDREIDESFCKVFDTSDLPSYSGKLKVVGSDKLKSAASFKIYAYNDEFEPEKDGTIAILKGAKSTDEYEVTSKGLKFNNFRYIKIISREAKDFKYTYNIERDNLVITVNEIRK